MMAAVEGNGIASGKETAPPPRNSDKQNTAEVDKDIHDHRQPFCEPNKTNANVETNSRSFTDIEDMFQKNIHNNPSFEDCDLSSSSYFDLLLSAYIPLILFWFRKSMFGPANLIRSIVVGQLVRLVVLDSISEWISKKLPAWLEVIFSQSSATSNISASSSSSGPVSTMLGAGSGKIDPQAWPPPAFTALALLTIFALIVHPDGLTWIVLGKLRVSISSVFSVLGQSMEFLLDDYGIFPTIIAATTLAALLFVVFVVLRTLSPKKAKDNSNKHNNSLIHERKKKKKKGGNARHKREHNHHQTYHRPNRIKSPARIQPDIGEGVENSSLVARPCSPTSSSPSSEIQDEASPHLALPLENKAESPIHLPLESTPPSPIATNLQGNDHMKEAANDKVPISVGPGKSNEIRTRRRMMSGSTLDTIPLSDDQSCGSMSVRSYPSVSVNSNRSGGGSVNKKSSKGSGSTPRRGKRNGTVKSPKNLERNTGKANKSATIESSVPSRWDVLKPDHSVGVKCSDSTSSHHLANGDTSKKKQSQYQQQQQQQRHRRGKSRRGHGMNGNGQSRKVRQNQRTVTTPGPSLPVKSVRSKIIDVSSIATTQQQNESINLSSISTPTPISSSCTSPSNGMTLPPPGFQNVSTLHGFDEKSVDKRRHQHHMDTNLSIHALFESERKQSNFSGFNAVKDPQHDVAAISPDFFSATASMPSARGFFNGSGASGAVIQDNPFSKSIDIIPSSSSKINQANLDSQIEADLQELGGQMAGSILDF